jgi:hypothetical protein
MLFLADCDMRGKTRSPTSAGIVPGDDFAALAGAESAAAPDCSGDETAADEVGLGRDDSGGAATAGDGFDSG